MAPRSNDDHPATKIAQALGDIEPITKSVTPPLYPASTYQRDADNQYRTGRVYGRPHNPTFETAERLLTALEGGAASLLFASGMAAATAAFLALKPGDHVVAPEVMYWGLRAWLKGAATEWGLSFTFVDASDTTAFARAIEPGRTKLVWLETPSNPTWGISDIAAIAKLAHAAGARVAVDSTVATPILTRPIEFGADLVMHSGTKYLNGHSDIIAGTLTAAKADEYWERIKAVRSNIGAILGTFEAWLLQRGMRTLHIRVERASQSALKIAQHFERHPLVAEVMYPGLPGFAGHALAAQQMTGGFGGMLSIRVKGGEPAAILVAAETRLWKRATSLGGVESLIEHRGSIEGPTSPVPLDLLRLSVGIEYADDLIADMEQALTAAHRESR